MRPIIFIGCDICNNKSNEISLLVLFKKIALLTLSGEQNVTISVDDTSYFDDGIKIDNSFMHFSEIKDYILNHV